MHDRSASTGAPDGQAGQATLDIKRAPSAAIMMLLPAALWMWLCWDWSVRLGFYSDDWMVVLHPFVGTADAFRDIANMVASRPVSVPFIWLGQVIADWSPARAQLLNAVMLLLTAASVGLLASALTSVVSGLRQAALAGACFASAAFIVFPSNVGTFAWHVGALAVVPAAPFFCVGTSLLLRAEGSWWRLGVGLSMALLSHLSYEAFYFQEITLLLIAATLRGNRIQELPWRTLAGAALVNVACLAFNRLTNIGIRKAYHPEFLALFTGGYKHVLAIFGHATREHEVLIATSVVIGGLSGAICLARFVGFARVQVATLLMICGIVASGFLYAFAGYQLAAEGTTARVGIVLATYYSLATGLLAAAAWRAIGSHRLTATTFFLFAVTSLLALGLTSRARVAEWADTWSFETARLSRLPAATASAEASAGQDHRLYLAVQERTSLLIAPATAPWEIGGAIAWESYQVTKSRRSAIGLWKAGSHWFATPVDWFNRWDGRAFEQGPCAGNVAYSVSASELWTWDTSSGRVAKADAPWQWGCEK